MEKKIQLGWKIYNPVFFCIRHWPNSSSSPSSPLSPWGSSLPSPSPSSCQCVHSKLFTRTIISTTITRKKQRPSKIYPNHISVVVDRFERSSRFCHIKFDKEAISDGSRSVNGRYQGQRFLNFKWFSVFSWASVNLVTIEIKWWSYYIF